MPIVETQNNSKWNVFPRCAMTENQNFWRKWNLGNFTEV